MQRNYALQKEVDAKVRDQRLLELETQNLAFEQKYYKSAEYQELAVRERMGLARPNERMLLLPPNTQAAKDADAKLAKKASTSEPQEANMQQWVNFLFGGNKQKLPQLKYSVDYLRIMGMMDEKEHIAKVLSGDGEAYRALVERYQTGLIIHCENIVKNRQEGEDIAQEAFIKAYRNLADFSEGKGRFSTWLYRIATNLCIDSLRKNKRRVHVKDIESRLEAVLPNHIENEEVEQLRAAIETLEPPKYAEIIKAYFWEGKSYQEIAAQYQTSANTVGTWLSRAKVQLKEKMS